MIHDATYPLFPIFAFLGFILCLIPIRWHLQAWNAGTCLYMAWASIACLNLFINSIVWRDNAVNWAPVWCDISSRIVVAVSVAIPTASLCINRRLYKIAVSQTAVVSREDKRRVVISDLSVGLGVPIVQIVFYQIVNGHRFDIYETYGCYPVTVNVWLAFPLVGIWPVVIGLISAVYCVLSLHAFRRRQTQFRQMIASNHSLTTSRYFRLMALAMTELTITTPIAIYALALNASVPLVPYRGWADLHFAYSTVGQFPAIIWQQNPFVSLMLQLNRWLVVLSAFIFFGFFGFASEARRQYSLALAFVAKLLHLQPLQDKFTNTLRSTSSKDGSIIKTEIGILPVFIQNLGKSKRESIDSFFTTSDIKTPTSSSTDIKTPTSVTSTTLDPYSPSADTKTVVSFGRAF